MNDQVSEQPESPQGMRQPGLPVELIGRIIQLYDLLPDRRPKEAPLGDLAIISPIFRAETERILYTEIALNKLTRVVKCFKTITARPHLARHVRTLSVALSLNSATSFDIWSFLGLPIQARNADDERRTGAVLKSFGRLVHQVLMTLVNLKEYSLSFGGRAGRDELTYSPPWLPSDAPFELRRFAVDLNASSHIIAFLANQPTITDLLAPHFSPERFPLPSPPEKSRTALAKKALILPQLAGVVAAPPVVASLVPKRPVWKVYMKERRFQPRHPRIVEAISALSKGTTPVKYFDTHVTDVTSAMHSIMDPLALNLPDLQGLTLRRVTITAEKPYDVYLTDAFCDKLSQFQKLNVLSLPSPASFVHLSPMADDGLQPGLHPGAPIAFEAHINAQIVIDHHPIGAPLGPHMPLPQGPLFHINAPMPPQPVVHGPPLPPNFVNPNHHPNQHINNNPNLNPPPPPLPQGNLGGQAPIQLAFQQMLNNFLGPAHGPQPQAQVPAPPPPPHPQPAVGPGNGVLETTAGWLNFVFGGIGGIGMGGPPLNIPGQPNNNPAFPPVNNPAAGPQMGGPMEMAFTDEELDDDGGIHEFQEMGPVPAEAPGNANPPLPQNQPPNLGNFLQHIFAHPNLTMNAPEPDPANAPAPGDGAPPNQPPLPTWNATVVGYIDPFTGIPVEDTALGQRRTPRTAGEIETDKKLEQGMKNLAAQELLILEKWKRLVPTLTRVTFEMDMRRRTRWTWKKADSSAKLESTVTDVEEDVGGPIERDSSTANGVWEVEYTLPSE